MAACAAVGAAAAQPHEQTRGAYTLRSSVVPSLRLAPSTAQEHGIEPSEQRSVLNVVVLRAQEDPTRALGVRADVQATARDLLGASRGIELREVAQRGGVSYVGVVDHPPRETLDFIIRAQPDGSDAPLELTYRERLWQR